MNRRVASAGENSRHSSFVVRRCYDLPVRLSDFDFALPAHLIAQAPPPERGASRLLVVDRAAGTWTDRLIADLPDLLAPSDLLVVNNSRVVPARLLGRREPSGGQVECLLLRQIDDEHWDVLMHPGQKMKPGTHASFGEPPARLEAEVVAQHTFGRRTIRLQASDGHSVDEVVDAIGHMPLPPYIKRDDGLADRERYQTIYASRRGSVAAPTAGLHLTPALLSALESRGVARAEVTLHVGYGTFEPVRTDVVEDHRLHPEPFEIDRAAATAIATAQREGRRIVSVGTTTTRTIEAVAAQHGGIVHEASGEASLFIYPGFHFQVAGGLLTNFHLPKSSLLLLVCAFAGTELTLSAYQHAIAEGYRFYSYGDAMLVV
jgi:S-adenosylmethionine:tRNA ribosyltransferase-isomerase